MPIPPSHPAEAGPSADAAASEAAGPDGTHALSYRPAALAAAATDLLERLAARLAAAGWRVSLQTAPDRLPMLDVANPVLGMLADTVTARPDADGAWWLWWSWAQRIGPAGDTERAAAVIMRVLGGHEA